MNSFHSNMENNNFIRRQVNLLGQQASQVETQPRKFSGWNLPRQPDNAHLTEDKEKGPFKNKSLIGKSIGTLPFGVLSSDVTIPQGDCRVSFDVVTQKGLGMRLTASPSHFKNPIQSPNTLQPTGPGPNSDFKTSDVNTIGVSTLDGSISNIQRTTPTTFPKFSALPVELRLEIWHLSVPQDRLVELEKTESRYGGIHSNFQVCPKSRQSPAIFLVCVESRQAGMKYYELKDFSPREQRIDARNEIYYNASRDIILLNSSFCVSTVQSFCEAMDGIERVAIMAIIKPRPCCWDIDTHENALRDCGFRLSAPLTSMQLLHGFHPPDYQKALLDAADMKWKYEGFQGCRGLKELYVVKPSLVSAIGVGQVDCTSELRRAAGNGVINTRLYGDFLLQEHIKAVESGMGLNSIGMQKWKGDKMPTFHLVNMYRRDPSFTQDIISDGMTVTAAECNWFMATNSIEELRTTTGCEITISPQTSGWEPWGAYGPYVLVWVHEVGILGTRKGVGLAKKRIQVEKVFSRLRRGSLFGLY